MNAIIISIGNELLSGHENTNASWLSLRLNENGINVIKIYTVADDKKEISKALELSLKESEIVFSTGGLGPTKDDITKNTLCKFFNCGLVFSDSAYRNIESLFKTRGLPLTNLNKKQAELPDKATAIPNLIGTAPGMWFETEGKTFIALPGVPFEMKAIFDDFIIHQLKVKHQLPFIVNRTILTQGIGESFLSETIADWEKSIPPSIKLAYLPSPGIVKLKLTGIGTDKVKLERSIENLISELKQIIPQYIYGYDNQKLEDIIGGLLINNNATLSTAESCTGGYLSHLITSCPGSSEYYKGSVIAYENSIKTQVLNIPEDIIEKNGAVSNDVAKMMAKNIRKLLKTTYGIGITGIAGPGGATPTKPVGTVWIAVASVTEVHCEMFLFGENRLRNIQKAAITALNMLRKQLV